MKVPSSWSQVKLCDYISLSKIDSNKPFFEYKMDVLSIFTGLNESELNKIKISEFNAMWSRLSFLKDRPKNKLKVRFKVKKKLFHFVGYIHQLTGGQFIDASTLIKDKDNITGNLPKILASVILPVKRTWYGKKYVAAYDGSDMISRADFFNKNLTMDVVFPISDFFFQSLEKSIPAIQTFLKVKMERESRSLYIKAKIALYKRKMSLLINGAG